MQVEKSVFISYRRTNAMTARAVYQHLNAQGYDCFLDYESIDAGSFERIILSQIAARAHFIVILDEHDAGGTVRRGLERGRRDLRGGRDRPRRRVGEVHLKGRSHADLGPAMDFAVQRLNDAVDRG